MIVFLILSLIVFGYVAAATGSIQYSVAGLSALVGLIGVVLVRLLRTTSRDASGSATGGRRVPNLPARKPPPNDRAEPSG
jgi:hypothetical protein